MFVAAKVITLAAKTVTTAFIPTQDGQRCSNPAGALGQKASKDNSLRSHAVRVPSTFQSKQHLSADSDLLVFAKGTRMPNQLDLYNDAYALLRTIFTA